MPNSQTGRYLLGYIIGGLLVLVLVPWGIWRASRALDPLIGLELIPFEGLRIVLAIGLFFLGVLFAVWSNVVQNTIGQGGPLEIAGLEVSPKTKHLVVCGPYKYTRNPMLFGACSMYYALAVYLNSPVAFGIVILFTVFMLIYVKRFEEPRLLKDFGDEYVEYRRRVSMFVPWTEKNPF